MQNIQHLTCTALLVDFYQTNLTNLGLKLGLGIKQI